MLNACILLKIVPTHAIRVIEAVKEVAGVCKAYLAYGVFDLVVFVEVENYKQLREITTEINAIEGIKSTETLPEA